LTYQAQSLGSD